MKSTDQILLEDMYDKVRTTNPKRKNLYTLKQDEQSVYAPVPKSLGSTEFYKKRFSLFDSEGNELPPTTPLQAGQIVNREFGVYFKVNKEGEEFVAEPSKLTPEVKNNIERPRAERIAQDKESLAAQGRPSY